MRIAIILILLNFGLQAQDVCLFDAITGDPDINGTWEVVPVGSPLPLTYDECIPYADFDCGVIDYIYIVGDECCRDTSTLTLTVCGLTADIHEESDCITGDITLIAIPDNCIAPYTYEWSNGDITADIIGVSGETYTVTVTDMNGCTEEVEVIPEYDPLEIEIDPIPDYCSGESEVVNAVASGGDMPYTYNWSTGDNIASFTSMETFDSMESFDLITYTVTVTDDNGCTATDDDQFRVYSLPIVLDVTTVIESCSGGDGEVCITFQDHDRTVIRLSIDGGATFDQINIDANLPTYCFTGLSAGTYNIVSEWFAGVCPVVYGDVILVQDDDCCIPPVEPTVECWEIATFDSELCEWVVTGDQPVEPLTECYETATFNDITCVWDVTGDQPTEPTTECYEVAIFDNVACTWVISGDQPTEPTIVNCWDMFVFDDLVCEWLNIGSQPTEPTTECYETATFNTGTCMWEVSGDPISIVEDSVTDETCGTAPDETNDGEIEISVSGGSGTYNFQWSNGSSLEDPFSLGAGTYTVTVTDTNGCTETSQHTVGDLNDCVVPCDVSVSLQNNNCTLIATVIGCDGGTVNWYRRDIGSTGAFSFVGSGLTYNTSDNGEFVVLVEDCCEFVSPVFITVTNCSNNPCASGFFVSGNVTDEVCSDGQGSITTIVGNGTPPYTYSWNTGQSTGNISGLSAGTYILTVTDSDGCVEVRTYTVGDDQSNCVDPCNCSPLTFAQNDCTFLWGLSGSGCSGLTGVLRDSNNQVVGTTLGAGGNTFDPCSSSGNGTYTVYMSTNASCNVVETATYDVTCCATLSCDCQVELIDDGDCTLTASISGTSCDNYSLFVSKWGSSGCSNGNCTLANINLTNPSGGLYAINDLEKSPCTPNNGFNNDTGYRATLIGQNGCGNVSDSCLDLVGCDCEPTVNLASGFSGVQDDYDCDNYILLHPYTPFFSECCDDTEITVEWTATFWDITTSSIIATSTITAVLDLTGTNTPYNLSFPLDICLFPNNGTSQSQYTVSHEVTTIQSNCDVSYGFNGFTANPPSYFGYFYSPSPSIQDLDDCGCP